MIEADTDYVLMNIDKGVMHIQMNRPERKNALSLAMYQKLADSVVAANEDPEVRVVLLSGVGGSFTSGNDLGDFAKHKGNLPDDENPTPKFMSALLNCDKPVIAAVDGPAVGIGTTLLLHCDFVYASKSAYLQVPFVKLGLCPEFGSSLILPSLMGHQRAADLLYFGESFSAEKAQSVGIVNEIVEDGKLIEFAMEKCRILCSRPASALRMTKQLMKKDIRKVAEELMQEERVLFGKALKSGEFAEAIAAFTQKREPDFSKFS